MLFLRLSHLGDNASSIDPGATPGESLNEDEGDIACHAHRAEWQWPGGGSNSPPSAWVSGGSSTVAHRLRRWTLDAVNVPNSERGAQSLHSVIGDGSPGKAKSTISIENSRTASATSRKGTISVSRGTTRKSTGAVVEAISMTAAGFFIPVDSPHGHS